MTHYYDGSDRRTRRIRQRTPVEQYRSMLNRYPGVRFVVRAAGFAAGALVVGLNPSEDTGLLVMVLCYGALVTLVGLAIASYERD